MNIIIAVGHSGFEKDQEIAKNVPDVDVVVGGHSNTFLYNGQSPSSPEKRLQAISTTDTFQPKASTMNSSTKNFPVKKKVEACG